MSFALRADLKERLARFRDEEFDLDDVRAVLAKWQRVLDWITLAPALEE